MHGLRGTLVLGLVALAAPAFAQVPCDDPDNFCTGDPCVIHDVEVTTPCTLDFGARTVVIGGRFRVQDSGPLDLSAGAFQVKGNAAISGGHLEPSGVGASIALHATGNIDSDGRLLGSGGAGAGSILLEAGGSVTSTGTIRAQARKTGSGGPVILRGAGGVTVERFIDVRGPTAGSIELSSTAGDVTLEDGLRLGGIRVSTGGTALLVANGTVFLNDRINASGKVNGGAVTISTLGSATGDISLQGTVKAAAKTGPGGSVLVELAPTGTLTGRATIDVQSRDVGGSICIKGGTVNAILRGKAKGSAGAGQIRVAATGDLTLDGTFSAAGAGGVIEAMAGGNLTLSASFSLGSGGCIAVSCAGTCDTSAASFSQPPVADCPGDCP